MSTNLDKRVNPCDDFYRYACANWERRTPIPPDRSSVSITSEMRVRYDRRLRQYLDAPIRRNDVNSYERKVKVYYKSCLKEFGRAKARGGALVDIITKKLGGWYVFDPNAVQTWNFLNAFKVLQTDYYLSTIFHLSVIQHPVNSDKNIIEVSLNCSYNIYITCLIRLVNITHLPL